MIEIINFDMPQEEMYLQIEHKIEANKNTIEQIKQQSNPSFDTLVVPIEKQESDLSDMWSLASHLQSVKNKEQVRQRHQEVQQKLAAYYSDIGFDKELMDNFKKVNNAHLDSEQQTVVSQALLNFHLSGVDLEKDKKDKLFGLRQHLSKLTTKFSENVLDATDKWVIEVNDDQLDGLNDEQKNYFKGLAKTHKKDSPYAIGLDAPSYQIILNYCDNRELRERLYKAYAVRASHNDQVNIQYNNKDIATDIIKTRYEIATTLGYQNYLEYSLANKFAQSPKDVTNFLDNLIKRVRPKALSEYKELERFALSQDNSPKSIQPWDIGYYTQKLKKERLNYNEEELREYFPCEHVINQMFDLFGGLYGFKVEQVENIQVWNEKVKAYKLISLKDNSTIGYLYADLFARQKKRGGAWMSDAQSYVNYQSWNQKPVAYLVCNFQDAQTPTLTFSDVETLFHEFGHTLHHLLTKRQLPSIAGINEVPWDIVELPSQLQEQWCFERDMLKKLSSHKETNEQLPDDKIDKIIESRQFLASLHLIRQLEFAKFDWTIHQQSKCEDPIAFWFDLRKDIAVMDTYSKHAFPLTFSHIFAGGYAAGYYSYLWAEAYAHQVFSHLKTHNFSTQATDGFKEHFLSVGGDLKLKEKLHQYLGDEQNVEPLINAYGIN